MHRRIGLLVAVAVGVLAALRSSGETRVWTGAASRFWSNPGNWSPAGALASGDVLVFPPETPIEAMTNDLPAGFTIAGAQFQDPYTLDGNLVTLTGNITGGTGGWVAPLRLGGAAGIDSLMTFYGAIDVNGQTLTIGRATLKGPLNGTGSIVATKSLSLSGSGDYSGTLEGPNITLTGVALPNMSVTGNPSPLGLTGYGTVGTVTVPPQSGLFPTGGALHTKSLALYGNLFATLAPSPFPLQVTGTVALGGSLFVTGVTPAVGQTITIIDNDGTDPVSGTFAGLPEHGVIVRDGGIELMISYAGGDGNDVTLTALHRSSTICSVVADKSVSAYGETVQWTVTVTEVPATAEQPTGDVTLFANGAAIGTAPLVNGSAVLRSAVLPVGSSSITASYGGDANFEPSVAPAIQLTVGKAPTMVDVQLGAPVYVGSWPELTVTVAATTSPALRPDGSVTVNGAVVFNQQTFADGSTRFTLAPLPPGVHTLSVAYAGSSLFQPSSTTVVQTVLLPSLSVHGVRVAEGDDGKTSVMVPVTLSVPVEVPVRISFSLVPGTATEDVDYERAGGVIEIVPGQQTAAVELHVIADTAFEPDETFIIVLSDPNNCAIETSSALIVIENDDAPPSRKRAARH